MYRDNEKTMCAGKSALGGAIAGPCEDTIAVSSLRDVLEGALQFLFTAKANVDVAESKLFGPSPCDTSEKAAQSPPIEVLAYQLRNLASTLAKQTASIEGRL